MLLTDKPNRTGILNINEEPKAHDDSPKFKDQLMRLSAVPKMKANYPLTSNQEFGWDADMPQYRSTWKHTKPSCPETKYANSYYTMTRKSPYSNKIGEEATSNAKK